VDELPLPDRPTAPSSFQLSRNDDGVPFWLFDGWPETEPTLSIQGAWPPSRRAIAIVGSATPALEARSWAFSLARFAAAQGWTIVSGLARGIDAAAHEGALAAEGRSIAVLANGLNTVFPPEHDDLTVRLLAHEGARITLASLNEPAARSRLLQRNALTSALSIAVVAVQSRGRDGTLATMRSAFQQNRILATCTPPAQADLDQWQGNALLLSDSPPWRMPDRPWIPAHRLDPRDEKGYVAFLESLDARAELLDSLQSNKETASMTESLQHDDRRNDEGQNQQSLLMR
jgi:DNA protecting protein DprA